MNREDIEDLQHTILILSEENKHLWSQLYSKDQIETKCPKCGEKFTINQCRVVASLEDRINKAIEFIEEHNYNIGKLYYKYNNKYLLSEIKEDLLEILKGE